MEEGTAGDRRAPADSEAAWAPSTDASGAALEIRFDVRVARAETYCTDTADAATCGVVGPYRFGRRLPDTVRVEPFEPVVVRHVVVNVGTTTLTSLDLSDSVQGVVLADEPVDIAPFDSAVVTRIYEAPAASGLQNAIVQVAARDAGGNEKTDATIYGIRVPAPEIRFEVRVAEADTYCTDTADASTCSVVGPYRFGQKLPDIVRVGPLEPVVVRHVLVNLGRTTLTSLDLSDDVHGAIFAGEPVDIAPFDSTVVTRIYEAPAAAGLQSATVQAAARDAGGNEAATSTVYGIRVPSPEIRFEVRVAEAETYCTDTADASTCSVVGPYRFGRKLPDTVRVDPLQPVVVRHVLVNLGTTTLTSLDLIDDVRGVIFADEPVEIAPFDSAVVTRIYEAPAAAGIQTATVQGAARDAGDNEAAASAIYGIDVPVPSIDLEVRVARASAVCSDVTDATTCRVIGPYTGAGPRPDTLFSLPGGTAYAVRYVMRNRGLSTLRRVTISDSDRGTVYDRSDVAVPRYDSVTVTAIYTSPTMPGIASSTVRAGAADAGGNEAAAGPAGYGVQTAGPAFRLALKSGLASEYCTNIKDLSTCSTKKLTPQPKAKETAAKQLTAKEALAASPDRLLLVYSIVNTGTVDFVSHTLRDNASGIVFQDSIVYVASTDSMGLYRFADDGVSVEEGRSAIWTVGTKDGDMYSVRSQAEPLPVELVAFEAEVRGEAVSLHWKTASESNNAGFEVQRLIEPAGRWATLGTVRGAGTTLQARTYRYDLGALDPDVYRFRLRQVDVDGTASLSAELEVTVSLEEHFRMTPVAPHPVGTAGRFSLTVREAQNVRIDVYDVFGRHVASVFDGTLEANQRTGFALPVHRLSSGTYFLRAVGERFAATDPVTVLR